MTRAKIEPCNRVKNSDSWICYNCKEELIKLEKLNDQINNIEAKIKNSIMQDTDTDETLEYSSKRPRLEVDPTPENIDPPNYTVRNSYSYT